MSKPARLLMRFCLLDYGKMNPTVKVPKGLTGEPSSVGRKPVNLVPLCYFVSLAWFLHLALSALISD